MPQIELVCSIARSVIRTGARPGRCWSAAPPSTSRGLLHASAPRVARPVISVLSLVVALGGTGYAAIMVGGNQIKNNAVTSPKIKNNSLTGKDIKECSLKKVPAAGKADTADQRTSKVGGIRASQGPLTTRALTTPTTSCSAAEVWSSRLPAPPTTSLTGRHHDEERLELLQQRRRPRERRAPSTSRLREPSDFDLGDNGRPFSAVPPTAEGGDPGAPVPSPPTTPRTASVVTGTLLGPTTPTSGPDKCVRGREHHG